MTRLILVRHGEPEAAARGRCYGQLDVALSPEGRTQAARTAAWLAASALAAPLAAVYASPRRRAVDTARTIAEPRDLPVIIHPALREIDFGQLEGLTYDEAAARDPDFYAAWMAHPTRVTFPGGESFATLRARVVACAAELRATHADQTIALVSHGGPLRALVAAALQLPDENLFRLDQSYGAVSILDDLEGTPVLRLLNQT